MLEKISRILHSYKINDTILSSKYENVGDYNRSLIKTAIALHFANAKKIQFGEQKISAFSSGFEQHCIKERLDACIFIIDKTFSSPTLFLSSLCQAILHYANPIVIIDKNIDEQVFEILISILELTGVEQSYYLPTTNEFALLLTEIANEKKIKTILCTKKFPPNTSDYNFIINQNIQVIATKENYERCCLAYAKEEVFLFEDVCSEAKKHLIPNALIVSFTEQCEGDENYSNGLEFYIQQNNFPKDFFIYKIITTSIHNNYEY